MDGSSVESKRNTAQRLKLFWNREVGDEIEMKSRVHMARAHPHPTRGDASNREMGSVIGGQNGRTAHQRSTPVRKADARRTRF